MDSRLKYIEGVNSKGELYAFGNKLVKKLHTLSPYQGICIVRQIEELIGTQHFRKIIALQKQEFSHQIAGVIHSDKPLYFILKTKYCDIIKFTDIIITDVDTYLDYNINNLVIK